MFIHFGNSIPFLYKNDFRPKLHSDVILVEKGRESDLYMNDTLFL